MADDTGQSENEAPLEQAEFDINDADSEVAHRAICDAVNGLNGVREVQFVGGGIVVTFNPIGITKEEICTAIRRSGYRATEITSSPGNAG
jgi:ABC-type phosphate transport system substrate-binding protein